MRPSPSLPALLACAALAACKAPAPPDAGVALPRSAPGVWLHPAAGVDAGVVRFIAVGDTGMGDGNQRAVADSMARVCAARGCDFVVLLGDNFYLSGVTSTEDPQWRTAFVEPYAAIQTPFFAVLGNHDYGGGGGGWEPIRAGVQVAYSKVNPRWVMPTSHYAWSWGPADFFATDTTRSFFGLDEQERVDFRAWLPASTATWKVALGHHALRSNGDHGNAGSYKSHQQPDRSDGAQVKTFFEQTVCGRADLSLSGHDHNLQWLEETCQGTELVVSGGGSKAEGFYGQNATRFQAAQLGFLYVAIEGRSLTGEFYDTDGGVLFSRALHKADAAPR